MYTLTFIYHYEEGKKFDLDYYLGTHRKKVADFLGEDSNKHIKKSTITVGRSGMNPTSPPHFNVITQLYFETEQDRDWYLANAKNYPSDLDQYSHSPPILVKGESL